jgi:hypothetical protein
MVSLELGSDVQNGFNTIQNTWKPPDQSSLHDICRTGIQPKADANGYFFKGYVLVSSPKRIGGAERDRTADPLLAKQVLSQLSYSPNHREHPNSKAVRDQVNPQTNIYQKANGGPGKT